MSRLLLLDGRDDRFRDGCLVELLHAAVDLVVGQHRLPFGAGTGEEIHQLGDVLDGLQVGQRAQDLDLERHVEVRFGGGPAKVLLEPVQDQPMLDLLRLPDVGVEGLVGLVDIRQQDEQLQHIAVDFQLYPCEIVDNVPELPGYKPWPLDRPIDRVQRDRRVQLTQPLNMFSDLLLGDVLPWAQSPF